MPCFTCNEHFGRFGAKYRVLVKLGTEWKWTIRIYCTKCALEKSTNGAIGIKKV